MSRQLESATQRPGVRSWFARMTSPVLFALSFAGYKLLILLMLNGDAVFCPGGGNNEQGLFPILFCTWSFLSAAMFAGLTLGCRVRGDGGRFASGRALDAWCWATVVAVAILIALTLHGPATVVGVAAVSITSAVVHFCWAREACRVPSDVLLFALVAGQLCASVLFLIAKGAGTTVQAIFLICSALALVGSTRRLVPTDCLATSDGADDALSDSAGRGGTGRVGFSGSIGSASEWRKMAGIAISTLGVGILWGSSEVMRDYTLWVFGAVAVGVAYLIGVSFFKRPLHEDAVLQAVFVLLGVAILLTTVVPSLVSMFMGTVWMGYSLLSLALFMVGRRVGDVPSQGDIKILGIAFSLSTLSIGAGLALGRMMLLGFPAIEAPAIVAVVLLLTLVVFFEKRRRNAASSSGVQPEMPHGEAWHDPCHTVATTYGLTLAEEETLSYLVRGYAIWRIAEERHVTSNTAKTQIGSIYRKLGVHSKQEALKVVESVMGNGGHPMR